MKIINKIAALALVVAGFTACNEAEDFDRYADHTYSNAIELGHYTSQYDANSKYTYGAVITLNAEGDTILYMYSTGKAGNFDEGKTRTLFTADTLNYDQKTGVVTAKADTSYYDEGETFGVQFTMAEMLDGERFAVDIAYGSKNETAILKRNTTDFPPVQGKWCILRIETEEVEGTENEEGVAETEVVEKEVVVATYTFGIDSTVVINDSEEPAGKYVTEGANIIVKDDKGETVATFAYNDNYQLTCTSSENAVMTRMTNQPEPETFNPLYEGNFIFATADLSGKPGHLFQGAGDISGFICQSDKDPSRYLLVPFINNEEGMLFTMDEAGKIAVDAQYTGAGDPNLGPIYATDVVLAGFGSDFPGVQSHYDKEYHVFYFDLVYHASSAATNPYEEIFKVTGEATNKKQFKAGKKTLDLTKKGFNFNANFPLRQK
ncbi:MAG: hypothetical protein SO133_04970 [Alloprevotella sp.]|nr:hypothetical protein [Alloprevotella sp.]